VRVQRSGVEVRSRSTFLVARASAVPEEARANLGTALQSPVDFTAIPIQGDWTGVSAGDGKSKRVSFELVLPANFAEINEADGNHLHVEFVAEAKSEATDAPVRAGQTLDVHLDAKGLEQIRRNGMTYRNSLKLAPGDYTVHFVVLDALNGRMGSVSAPLKVAP
jgi:hypothetical protein